MNNANGRFVALPMMLFLDKQGLKKEIEYKDLLIYITLKSFHNSTNQKCFPAYETIAERSGLSRNYVIKSLKRLKLLGVIEIEKSSKKRGSNNYKFPDYKYFEQIPYELFDANLDSNTKAMFLCLRYLTGSGLLTYRSITKISSELGLSYNTVYPLYKKLRENEYIEDIKSFSGRNVKGFCFTNKLNWVYDYKKSGQVLQGSDSVIKVS